MVKTCLFKSCKNYENVNKKVAVFFIPIPKKTKNPDKCERWLKIINKKGFTSDKIKCYHYVCSIHFVGGNGPTIDHPDPIPDIVEYEDPTIILTRAIGLDHSYFKNKPKENADIVKTETSIPHQVPETVNEPDSLPDVLQTTTPTLIEEMVTDSFEIEIPNEIILETTHFKIESSIIKREYEDRATSPIFITCHESTTRNIATSPLRNEIYSQSFYDLTNSDKPLEKLAQMFYEFRALNIKTVNWLFQIERVSDEGTLELISFSKLFSHSFLNVSVKSDLEFSLLLGKRDISENHAILEDVSSCRITSFNDLLDLFGKLNAWLYCDGVSNDSFWIFKDNYLKNGYFCYVTRSFKSYDCEILFKSVRANVCVDCRRLKKTLQNRLKEGVNTNSVAKTINTRYLDKNLIKLRFKALNIRNRVLTRRNKNLQLKIDKLMYEKNTLLPDCEDSFD